MREVHFVPEVNRYLYTMLFEYKGVKWQAADYITVKQHKSAKAPIEKEYLWNNCVEAMNKRIAEEDKQEALDNGWHYGLGLGV